jgi:hypothetical protein
MKAHDHPIYHVWANMLTRCRNPNYKQWADYGGRGIHVCERWQASFWNFAEDMGERPEGHQLDRIDNNGDYEPSNCRWVPPAKNRRNRARGVTRLTFNNKTQCLTDWANELGIKRSILSARVNRLNWPIEKALATPVRGN